MIGDTVSHYRIVEKLGGGGMGVVYRAEDTHLGRDVALKFLPPELTRDAEARDRFTLEARAASALDHANICTIHDIDETDDGRLFIAMAFYRGETLKARLGHGPLALGEALRIARGIASGLARAHEGGIVHRDIKPANLMLTAHGEVKILDFGVAKLAGEAGMTRTGTTLGTLAYMAPEQIDGARIDARVDVWALGVVLYEMLAGRPPFRGKSESEIVASILTREPEPLAIGEGPLATAARALVTDLLSKRAEDRPSSAKEVVHRLDAMLAPPAAEATTMLRRPSTWVAAALAVVLLAAALVVPARRRASVDAARASLAEIETLTADRRYAEAFALAMDARRVLGEDTTLARLLPEVSDVLTVRSEPPGATVYVRALGADSLESLGTTPIEEVRLPRSDYYVLVQADGYEPAERIASSVLDRTDAFWGIMTDRSGEGIELDVPLVPVDSLPPEMVPVSAGAYTLVSADAPAGATADLGDYLIDRFEVTNQEYREFVRAGGYAAAALWDATIPDAATRFVDRTRLPGPREWTSQQYPQGTDRHPVSSVTWFEAAAYCRWRGKALPTLFEWEKAARGGLYTHTSGFVLPWGVVEPGQSTEQRANFGGTGTVPVDAYPFGISPYGAYGMAGNVREWTANPTEDGYIAMGGSWEELSYVFSSISTLAADFAAPDLGFRCVRRSAPGAVHGEGTIELARRSPSYTPVSEAEYRSYLAHYAYDPVDLRPEVLETSRTEDWTRLEVRFDGVGGDTILAYLYLPAGATPPYQTLVFVPSVSAFFTDGVDEQIEWLLAPHIRSGRAAFGVVMDGMVGRQTGQPSGFPPSNTVEFRNLMVKHATELSIGLDYLQTRDDIDMDRLAYVGLSWGAGSRSVFAAVDDRWDAVIFIGGGIDERLQPTVPEALNVNFVPYIRVPKLLVNGRQDEEHPWLTRGLPFWELLSEPKELALFEDEGHHPSPEVRVPAVNDFLDRTFGPVR